MSLLTALAGFAGLLARDAAPEPPPPPPPAPPQIDAQALYNALLSTGMVGQQTTPFQLYSTRPVDAGDMARIFAPAKPMRGVVPDGVIPMAMDDLNNPMSLYGGYQGITEGMAWLGYPYLAELAQRTEYRRMSETIAKEMTRRWFKLIATGDDDKTDKITALEACMREHKLQEKFALLALLDGFFGRAHLYIDTGVGDDLDQMKLPLLIDPRVIGKNGLKALRVIEPMWCYANRYNANDPLRSDFYLPQSWYVMGKEIHRTRILPFISREMPDMLKPAYSFGGLSLSQMAKPYVDNWLRTRQSVSDLVHSFSTPVLMTNMGSVMNAGASQALQMRAALFNYLRDNNNMMVVDKTTEDFKNVAAPLGSLDHLQAQSQEHISSAVGIPLVVLTGISPSGLNSSSEFELQVWAQWIHANQTSFFDANLKLILDVMQLDQFGEIDPDISHAWEPLEELSEAEKATADKTKADTDVAYINAGVLSPDEVRQNLSGEAESPYPGLDLEGPAPPPPQQEQDPLAGAPGGDPEGGGAPPGPGGPGGPPGTAGGPAGGRPNPIKPTPPREVEAGGSPAATKPNASRDEGGSREVEHTAIKIGENDNAQVHLKPHDELHIKMAADGSLILSGARRDAPFGQDAEFEESNVKRDQSGKFAKSRTYSKTNPPQSSHLHDVEFKSWDAPKDSAGWKKEAETTPHFEEPEMPATGGKKQGAGVIVQEPDGRVWVIHPTNQYGGYSGTFPKGGVDKGDSLHATAIKEAYEESGLHVQLTGYAGDANRGTSVARYYYAKRIGGTPADHGWESEGVTLSPPDELHHHLNTPLDRRMAVAMIPGAHKESPIDTAKMEKTGGKLGSNPGGKYKDSDGKEYYVKDSKSDSHAKNEILASRLYDAAGAPALHVMPATTPDGKLGTATEWQKTEKINPKSEADRTAAQKHFAAHAWLANWDAPGLTHDNQARIDGKMTTLDSGGALLYRAQGGEKGDKFGDDVGEWDTLRSPSNKQAHDLFGSMTPAQLQESASRVVRIPSSHIRNAVNRLGPGSKEERAALAERLIKRRNDIAQRAGGGLQAADSALAWAFDAMIGEWEEEAHPRDEGGKFTAGSGAGEKAEAPAPPPHQLHVKVPGNKIKSLADSLPLSAEKDQITEVAGQIKDIAGQYKHSAISTYANSVLAHLESQHGLSSGNLGKAKKMPTVKGEKAAPEPAAEPNPLEGFKLNEAEPASKQPDHIPDPNPNSPTQLTIHQVGTGENTVEKKIGLITDIASGQSDKDQQYALAWLYHLEQLPKEEEEPSATHGQIDDVVASNDPLDQKIKAIIDLGLTGSQQDADYADEQLANLKKWNATEYAEMEKAAKSQSSPDPGKEMENIGFAAMEAAKLDPVALKAAIADIEAMPSANAEVDKFKAGWLTTLQQTWTAKNQSPPAAPKMLDPEEQMHAVAESAMPHEQKIALLEKVLDSKTVSKEHKQIAETLIKVLDKKQTAAAPPPAPKPVPPPIMESSATQTSMHEIATGTETDAQKVAYLKASTKLQDQLAKSPTGTTAQYYNQLMEALGGEPLPGVVAPQPKPPPPPPKPSAAQKAAAEAPKTAKHGSLTAPANAQVTQARKGAALSHALKQEADAVSPASTDTAAAREAVPSLRPDFWAEVGNKHDNEAVESYGGGGYSKINGVLRGNSPITEDALKKIDSMDGLMNEPGTRTVGDKPVRLIRGEDMEPEQIKKIKDNLEKGIGTVAYQRMGYTSASIGEKPGYKASANTYWQFTAMPGARMLGIAASPAHGIGHGEREVVLPNGITVEVYEMYHDGKRHIIKALYR
jgi:hypothetical protein